MYMSTTMELGPNRPSLLWFGGPNSIMVVHMDPWVMQDCRLLGRSWVVISGAISQGKILMTLITGLKTPLITTHEPPSRP